MLQGVGPETRRKPPCGRRRASHAAPAQPPGRLFIKFAHKSIPRMVPRSPLLGPRSLWLRRRRGRPAPMRRRAWREREGRPQFRCTRRRGAAAREGVRRRDHRKATENGSAVFRGSQPGPQRPTAPPSGRPVPGRDRSRRGIRRRGHSPPRRPPTSRGPPHLNRPRPPLESPPADCGRDDRPTRRGDPGRKA